MQKLEITDKKNKYEPVTFSYASRKHLRTKVTPDFPLTDSKNGENLGSGSK